jgi:hypothetical protein
MKVMVIIKANEQSEAGVLPSEKLLNDMTAYNEELVKAGVMFAGEGLHPSSRGKRVLFAKNGVSVQDGPFEQTNELIAGFWLWKVNSMDEAVEWVKRMPGAGEQGEEIVEIRPIFENDDFGEALTPELREREERMRSQTEG